MSNNLLVLLEIVTRKVASLFLCPRLTLRAIVPDRLAPLAKLAPGNFENVVQTTYHSRTPQVCDEIKVQLPEHLTNRHRLVFTVFHVHVRRKTGGMFKSGNIDEQV